jgi:CTP synthase
MLNAIRYARENKVPYFGICLGMQTACIEYARNVCGLDANSGEFDPARPAPHHLQAARAHRRRRDGRHHAPRRLGLQARARLARRQSLRHHREISERHRHRYEFNREYEAHPHRRGLRLTGTTPDATYVEIVEIPTHPFFLGCQFHPEFKSKPLEPHPLFRDFAPSLSSRPSVPFPLLPGTAHQECPR